MINNINTNTNTKCGFVALVGKPNVGKSSLLNRLVGQKVSIISHKAQTTRHKILGVKTEGDTQIIFVDTPGMHLARPAKINEFMNDEAKRGLIDVDLVLWLVNKTFDEEDELVLQNLSKVCCPVILVLNKIDLIKDKKQLLPKLEELAKKRNFLEIIPVSVIKDLNIDKLQLAIKSNLPDSVFFFADGDLTDKNESFRVTELIREQLMSSLQEEVPYSSTVTIDTIEHKEKIVNIHAVIWVARASQKGIVIGDGGETLKGIGSRARFSLEKMYGKQVFLKLWVKIKPSWSDNSQALSDFGYDNK